MIPRAALLLAAWTLPAAAEICRELRPVPVYLPVAVPIDAGVLAAAREEAAWILRSLCVAIEWSAAESPGALLVRILPRPLTADPTPDALGLAMPTLGRGAVFLSRVREKVEANPGRVGLPILLGCVLAHEIGHLLLGTVGHAKEGIMSADFQKRELEKAAQRQLVFTAADRLAMVPAR
jgi:hypothetical protein